MSNLPVPLLITGGCGFVGLNLLGYLLEQGVTRVRILDNLSVGTREDLEEYLKERGSLSLREEEAQRWAYDWTPRDNPSDTRSISLIAADIRDSHGVAALLGDGEAVVHLAAQTDVIRSVEDPYNDFENNVLGILNMLQAAAGHKCPAFVFASSAAPMGNQPPPDREDIAPRPLSPYGAAKLAGEGYCCAFTGSFGLPTAALRFANVYGPYSTYRSSVIAKFLRQALLGETLVIYGDGDQTRDFVHTRDLAQAIYRALTALLKDPKNVGGELFQVATGRETRINELFGMIKELVERDTEQKVHLEYVPPRAGEIYRYFADISKAKSVLGFSPDMDLRTGVEETWAWFRTKFPAA